MNQTCKVCGEPAAGFHFGAFTCEGCKSFFGRSFNNVTAISDCKNNGECVINKKNRTACKACRLRKCLMVGMSKSGSRYGRRSNWFKIHCLLQEQQDKQQLDGHHGLTSSAPYSFGLSSNGFGLQKSKEEDYKTVSTPSTSPASSQISDTTISSIDLLSKLRASAGNEPPLLFDHTKHPFVAHNNGPNKLPKDFFLPMAFPGMPFPLPPTNLAQLFLSGFGAAAANHPSAMHHHYQEALKAQAKGDEAYHRKQIAENSFMGNPFMGLDPILLQKQMQEEHHRIINSPPASVSPTSPPQSLSCEPKSAPSSDINCPSPSTRRLERVIDSEEDGILVEPSAKRPKHLPACGGGNDEESSNIATVASSPRKILLGDEPLDLSLTKGDHDDDESGLSVTAASAVARQLPTVVSPVNRQRPEKYKGTDCPPKWIGQTGEAAAAAATATEDERADDDVQVDMDDQKQTAFFDYLKQTFIRENQFLKIKNNEIYSF